MSAPRGTSRRARHLSAALLSLAAASGALGCGSETTPHRPDGGSSADAGPLDAGDPSLDADLSDAGALDAETPADAGSFDGGGASRCTVTPTSVACPHETTTVSTGAALPLRHVHFQVPLGTPPVTGFPVVIAFQGTALPAALTWAGASTDPYGMYYQALVVARLLDAGYAVLTPETANDGASYYDTNVPLYSTAWETAPDHQLMLGIFAGIEAGDFGPLNPSALFAVGFSSGGYMTSRMAVSYPGRFRSLAIQSASYATCGGALCTVPATLPADHPPTLFLHGGADTFVPMATMVPYEAQLRAQGIATRIVTESTRGHEWLPASPDEVLAWFDASR